MSTSASVDLSPEQSQSPSLLTPAPSQLLYQQVTFWSFLFTDEPNAKKDEEPQDRQDHRESHGWRGQTSGSWGWKGDHSDYTQGDIWEQLPASEGRWLRHIQLSPSPLGRALPRLMKLFASLVNSNSGWQREMGCSHLIKSSQPQAYPVLLTPWTNALGPQSPECVLCNNYQQSPRSPASLLPNPFLLCNHRLGYNSGFQTSYSAPPSAVTGNTRSLDHSSRPKAQTGRKKCRGEAAWLWSQEARQERNGAVISGGSPRWL